MGYKDIINNFEPIDYSKYKNVTSNEKLMLYAARRLEENHIPITFNYLCIATYKIFPDKFCFDEEFKEYPSADRLNRTVMHLNRVKDKKPFLAGSIQNGFSITSRGYALIEEVEAIINNTVIDKSIKAPIVDQHKKGFGKDYIAFISGEGYKKYLETGIVDEMYVWNFYNIIPYTLIKTTKKNLGDVLEYAKEKKDKECIKYIEEVLKRI